MSKTMNVWKDPYAAYNTYRRNQRKALRAKAMSRTPFSFNMDFTKHKYEKQALKRIAKAKALKERFKRRQRAKAQQYRWKSLHAAHEVGQGFFNPNPYGNNKGVNPNESKTKQAELDKEEAEFYNRWIQRRMPEKEIHAMWKKNLPAAKRRIFGFGDYYMEALMDPDWGNYDDPFHQVRHKYPNLPKGYKAARKLYEKYRNC